MRKRKSLVPLEDPSWLAIGGRLDSVLVMRLRLLRKAFLNIVRLPFLVLGWFLSVLWRALK